MSHIPHYADLPLDRAGYMRYEKKHQESICIHKSPGSVNKGLWKMNLACAKKLPKIYIYIHVFMPNKLASDITA